ncbi:hypothetical protein ACFOZY_13020 [Chungangia koreensis]|uniref:Uncharacterized protein n=1 Tax=Chungangia koreensis TaxID=752657 RepID=A0ABV8X7G8_9LACT
MDDRQFENRVQLLKKSYERVPSEFNPEEVLQKLDDEPIQKSNIEPQKSKKDRYIQKASVWLVSLASVFLLGIIAATFLINEEDPQTSGEISDEYIEQLKKDYQAEREKRREMLKMEEERFSDLGFVKWSDQMIALITSEREVDRYTRDGSPEKLKEDYEDTIKSLMLPSEMAEELKEASLREDESGSIEFLTEYRNKIQSLQTVYNDILADYPEALEMNKAEGQYNETLIMIASKGEPEEFKNMVDTMTSQNLRVKVNEVTGLVSAELYSEDFNLLSEIHPNVQYYYQMMFDEPYLVAGSLRYSLEESAQKVQEMQYALLNVERDHNLYTILENYFSELFYELMKGSDQAPVFDENGVVKKEYQEIWLNLSSASVTAPTYYLLKPIITEMEESGWTKSASYDHLTIDDIKTALVLARDGKLTQFIGDIIFEDRTVSLSDSAFWDDIEKIYNEFKDSKYNLDTIKGMHPIDALGLLEYANKMDDPYVVYHLIDKSESGITDEDYINEYVERWTRRRPLLSGVDQLTFKKDSLNGSAQIIHWGVVNGENQGEPRLSFTMIYTEKEIWNLHLNYWFEDPSIHNEDEIPIDDDFMQRVHALYKNFAATKDEQVLRDAKPSEIVGLYFYTGELKDYETQYALFYQDDERLPTKEQYLKDVEQFGAEPIKFRELFKSISFKSDEPKEMDIDVGGYATLYVDRSRNPDEEKVKGFRLRNTHAGWRVSFMPMQ